MKQFNLTSVKDSAIMAVVAEAKAHHQATGEHVQVMKAGLCYFVQKENKLHGKSLGDAIKSLFS